MIAYYNHYTGNSFTEWEVKFNELKSIFNLPGQILCLHFNEKKEKEKDNHFFPIFILH